MLVSIDHGCMKATTSCATRSFQIALLVDGDSSQYHVVPSIVFTFMGALKSIVSLTPTTTLPSRSLLIGALRVCWDAGLRRVYQYLISLKPSGVIKLNKHWQFDLLPVQTFPTSSLTLIDNHSASPLSDHCLQLRSRESTAPKMALLTLYFEIIFQVYLLP